MYFLFLHDGICVLRQDGNQKYDHRDPFASPSCVVLEKPLNTVAEGIKIFDLILFQVSSTSSSRFSQDLNHIDQSQLNAVRISLGVITDYSQQCM